MEKLVLQTFESHFFFNAFGTDLVQLSHYLHSHLLFQETEFLNNVICGMFQACQCQE